MLIDAQLRFSNAQTVTTGTGSGSAPGVRSTNIIDLRAAASRYGSGKPLFIHVLVSTTFTSSGSNDALDVNLYTDADEAFGSPTIVQKVGTLPAVSAAGTRIIGVLSPDLAMEQYIGLYFVSQTTDPLTAGAVTAFISDSADAYRSYADAITIS